jgi:anti-anti-sigma factor
MQMTTLQRDDGITHIVLDGRLDTTATDQIKESFAEATAALDQPAIVDLSHVKFLASRGIGLLLASGKQLKNAGHCLVLVSPQELVARVLRTSKVDIVMPIAGDLEEAIRLARGDTSGAGERESTVTSPPPDVTGHIDPTDVALEGELRVAIRNELSELEGLNAKLAQFLAEHQVAQRATYAVNLAIDELVVNVIRYAYVDDDAHTIDIALAVEGEQIILRITDDGRPFDPRTGPSLNLHAEEREVGGLGLILVLDMVDVLHYERSNDKNCVEVRVHLVPDDEHGDLPTGA